MDDLDLNIVDAVKRAAAIQLRPNLMTMLLALLGLIPAARATGIGSDVQRPLATVIVGGLSSALIMTPLVLPAIYLVFVRRKNNKTQTPSTDQ